MINSSGKAVPQPNFHSIDFLTDHLRSIVSFYYPQCIDEVGGGYFQHFDREGRVSHADRQRHLVSSSRLTINFAVAARQFPDQNFLDAARHGVTFLRDHHRNPATGGYAWIVEDGHIRDGDNQCYGIAFVLMAYAHAYAAGAKELYDCIGETFQFMERYFWRSEDQLYLESIDVDLKNPAPYRGQNSNMHCCEAMISAYEATDEPHYLDRAIIIARRVTVDLAAQCEGRIWEHYNDRWQVDFDYNAGDYTHKLRPWGYQPGHFTEWTKLLLLINKYRPRSWLVSRAKALFDLAIRLAFDSDHCGLFYGFSPSGEICSDGKYSWVQAETIVAAALLATQQNDRTYWCIYHQFWQYVWENMIDHDLKCWHRNLSRDNKVVAAPSVAMGRTDYHAICACREIITLLS